MADPFGFGEGGATVTDLQQKGRTHHSSSSGIEITREFYCEPYQAYPRVIDALQGSVDKGDDDQWVRTPPLRDTIVKNCYCTETVVDFEHPDALAATDYKLEDGLTAEDVDLTRGPIAVGLEDSPELLVDGAAGAKIVAHYRPLITAWQQGDLGDEEFDDTKIWDWLDPVFTGSVRQIPWPPGLFITEKLLGRSIPHGMDDSLASPLGVTVFDLAIKRTLVGKVPVTTMGRISSAVNDKAFPEDGSPAANGLGPFPPRTLRYDTTSIRNMLTAKGKQWFELTHHFKWISSFASKLFDIKGNPHGPDFVTWNHVFTHPSTFGFDGPTGWYEVWRSEDQDVPLQGLVRAVQGLPIRRSSGRLYDEANFMELFDLQAK